MYHSSFINFVFPELLENFCIEEHSLQVYMLSNFYNLLLTYLFAFYNLPMTDPLCQSHNCSMWASCYSRFLPSLLCDNSKEPMCGFCIFNHNKKIYWNQK